MSNNINLRKSYSESDEITDKECEAIPDKENGETSASVDSFNSSGLKQILISCKLENLLSEFTKQEIDDEFLLSIEVSNAEEWSQLSELLPTIGAKWKFKKALAKFQVSSCFYSIIFYFDLKQPIHGVINKHPESSKMLCLFGLFENNVVAIPIEIHFSTPTMFQMSKKDANEKIKDHNNTETTLKEYTFFNSRMVRFYCNYMKCSRKLMSI